MPDGACIAVDYSGQVFQLTGANAVLLKDTHVQLFDISCPSRYFCAAVGANEAVVFLPSGVRSFPLTYSAQSYVHWQSISCSAATFCMAGGGIAGGPQNGAGVVASWNGLEWSAVRIVLPDIPHKDLTQISSMSCAAPSFCVGGDGDDRVVQWNGTNCARAN